MSRLIPHLKELTRTPNGFGVPDRFVPAFLLLHNGNETVAEDHWELIVSRVLNTDAVHPRATGAQAVRQAVAAAYALLAGTALQERCPLCVHRRRP